MAQKMLTKQSAEQLNEETKQVQNMHISDKNKPAIERFVQFSTKASGDLGKNALNKFIDLTTAIPDEDLNSLKENNTELYDVISVYFGSLREQFSRNVETIEDIVDETCSSEEFLGYLVKRFEILGWFQGVQFHPFVRELSLFVFANMILAPLNILDIYRISVQQLGTIKKVKEVTHSEIPSNEYFTELEKYMDDMGDTMKTFFSCIMDMPMKEGATNGESGNKDASPDTNQGKV